MPLKSAAIFSAMATSLSADVVKQVNAVYQWNVTSDGKLAGQWAVDLKTGAGAITEGVAKAKADCTLTLDDNDLVALFNGSLDATKVRARGLRIFR